MGGRAPRQLLTVLNTTEFEAVVRTAAIAVLALIPALLIIRQIQRAAIRGTAIEPREPSSPRSSNGWTRSPTSSECTAPAVYLANGNGTLNAFAAQSGLGQQLRRDLQRAVRQPAPRQPGRAAVHPRSRVRHIRLHHVALWYQLSICYSQLIPILGPTLSRLREYSCDRHGAA